QRVDEVRARRPILERVLRGVEQRRFPDDGAVVAARELRLLPVGIVGGIAKEDAPGVVEGHREKTTRLEHPSTLAEGRVSRRLRQVLEEPEANHEVEGAVAKREP